MRELIKKSGRVFFWTWIVWAVAATSWSMFKVIRGDAPFHSAVLYSTMGGFFLGLLAAYIPVRIAHRYEIRKVNEKMLEDLRTAKKRIDPLLLKVRKEMDAFVEKLAEGQYDEAQVHKDRMNQLQSYVDAVIEEQFDCGPVGTKKLGEEKEG